MVPDYLLSYLSTSALVKHTSKSLNKKLQYKQRLWIAARTKMALDDTMPFFCNKCNAATKNWTEGKKIELDSSRFPPGGNNKSANKMSDFPSACSLLRSLL